VAAAVFDHLLRGFKDRMLAPFATLFRGVAPNTITLIALVFGLGAAVAAARGAFGLGLALWIANRMTDGLDGSVARVAERQSDFGGYLDILLDFIVYAAIPVGFAIGLNAGSVFIAAAVLEATFFVNACSWMYLSAVLEKRAVGASSRGELTTVTMPPALVAGFETIVFYALFFLFPGRLALLFAIMAAMVSVNVVQRLIWARKVL
jgi:phosphatidylglycerophosphate synthase